MLGLDVGTELDFLYVSFDRSNKFALILLGGTLGFTDVEVIGYDQGIQLGFIDGKLLGTIFGDVDGITHGLDVGTELCPSDGSFEGSNDGKFEIIIILGIFRYTDSKVLGSNEGSA